MTFENYEEFDNEKIFIRTFYLKNLKSEEPARVITHI